MVTLPETVRPEARTPQRSAPAVSIRAEIVDVAAYVSVEQTFTTRASLGPVAEWSLPLPRGAVLHAFEVRLGSKAVLDAGWSVASSRGAYERRHEGQRAILLEPGPKDINLSLAEIPPGQQVTLRLTYATELTQDEKQKRELRIPLAADHSGKKGRLDAAVALELTGQEVFASCSYDLGITEQKGDRLLLRTALTTFIRDDFVVSISPRDSRFRPVLLTNQEHFLLGLQLPTKARQEAEVEIFDLGLRLKGLVFPTGRPCLQGVRRTTLYGRHTGTGGLDVFGRWVGGHEATWYTRLRPRATRNRALPVLWARAHLQELAAQTPRDERGERTVRKAYRTLGVVPPSAGFAWIDSQLEGSMPAPRDRPRPAELTVIDDLAVAVAALGRGMASRQEVEPRLSAVLAWLDGERPGRTVLGRQGRAILQDLQQGSFSPIPRLERYVKSLRGQPQDCYCPMCHEDSPQQVIL